MREWLTALLLAALFAASVLNQLPLRRWAIFVGRVDRWTCLPFWSFFAPEPGYTGTHLVYRDGDGNGWTKWAELEIPDTTGWRWLWNPGRFERKALQDFLNGFARIAQEVKDPRALELTACHLSLVAWVRSQPPLQPDSTRRQFALLQSIGHSSSRSLRPVVVSREYLLA